MSDRVAVFSKGRIEQIGTPVEIYERPATEFVAGFVGVSNILTRDGARVMLRPEKIRLVRPGDTASLQGWHMESGMVREAVYAGMVMRYAVELADGLVLTVIEMNAERPWLSPPFAAGDTALVAWRPENAVEIGAAGMAGVAG